MIANPVTAEEPNGHSPSVQLLLALLQASLGFVLVSIFVFFIVGRDLRVSILSGVGIHLVGFATAWLLAARIPRRVVIWSVAFAIVPLLVTPFAGRQYLADGFWPSFGFWLGFSLSLLATSALGGMFGARGNRLDARKS